MKLQPIYVDDITIEKITKGMLFHSGEAFTTSTQIANMFGIRHDDLLRKIRSFNSFEMLTESRKIAELKRLYRGQEFPYFELDADAYAFTCLSITGKKAERFKWAFIEAFKKVTAEAISAKVAIQCNKRNDFWIEARHEGKNTRKALQEKIKEFCQYAEEQRGGAYPKTCPYYKIITSAVYEFLGLEAPKASKSLRDIYSGDIVEAIENTEIQVIKILNEFMLINETRKGLKNKIIDRLRSNIAADEVDQ
jgi:Rha family phage regulatory protein